MKTKHISSFNLEKLSLPNRLIREVSHRKRECFWVKGLRVICTGWEKNSLNFIIYPQTMEMSFLLWGICCPMRVEIKVDSTNIYQHLGKFSSNFNFSLLFEENTGSNLQENHSGPHQLWEGYKEGQIWKPSSCCWKIYIKPLRTVCREQIGQDSMFKLSCPMLCKWWLCNSWDHLQHCVCTSRGACLVTGCVQ